MSSYAWVKTKRSEEGLAPALTEDASFAVLLYLGSSWALVSYSVDDQPIETIDVSRGLNSLLRSAVHYPPALVIAMKRFRERKIKRRIDQLTSRLELEKEICEEIREVCQAQRSSSYVFAEATIGDSIDFRKGEFYWLVARTRERVWWIDRDLELGISDRTSFELSASAFERLKEIQSHEEL